MLIEEDTGEYFPSMKLPCDVLWCKKWLMVSSTFLKYVFGLEFERYMTKFTSFINDKISLNKIVKKKAKKSFFSEINLDWLTYNRASCYAFVKDNYCDEISIILSDLKH